LKTTPLVAEDIAQQLRKLGYEVVAVIDNGEEAVKQTFALGPDLVLMDVGLRGGMDGNRGRPANPPYEWTPGDFLTCHSDPVVLRRAKESEPYGYILKPFADRDLLVQIEIALYRHQVELERAQLRREQAIAHDNLRASAACCRFVRVVKRSAKKTGSGVNSKIILPSMLTSSLRTGFCPECENRFYGTNSRPPIAGLFSQNSSPAKKNEKTREINRGFRKSREEA